MVSEMSATAHATAGTRKAELPGFYFTFISLLVLLQVADMGFGFVLAKEAVDKGHSAFHTEWYLYTTPLNRCESKKCNIITSIFLIR